MEILFWIYLVNAVLLINHEIDSAYWQEWRLMKISDKNGIDIFLLLHFPVIFVVLLGLVYINEYKFTGLIISLLLSLGGIFAFCFHFYHIRKGKPEFNTIISKTIIIATFLVSIFQIYLTLRELNIFIK
jgi:hypothetical protein